MQGADWLSLRGVDRKWPEIGVARASPPPGSAPWCLYRRRLQSRFGKLLGLEPVGPCRNSGPRLGPIGLSSQGALW